MGKHIAKSSSLTFINYVRATFNHGLSPSEVDWGDLKGELTEMLKYTSNGCMVMEVDWGGNLKLIYTSCGCMLMEVDWGDKLIVNLWLTGELMELTQMDTTSLKLTGEAVIPDPTI